MLPGLPAFLTHLATGDALQGCALSQSAQLPLIGLASFSHTHNILVSLRQEPNKTPFSLQIAIAKIKYDTEWWGLPGGGCPLSWHTRSATLMAAILRGWVQMTLVRPPWPARIAWSSKYWGTCLTLEPFEDAR